jgi:hypothetical protein
MGRGASRRAGGGRLGGSPRSPLPPPQRVQVRTAAPGAATSGQVPAAGRGGRRQTGGGGRGDRPSSVQAASFEASSEAPLEAFFEAAAVSVVASRVGGGLVRLAVVDRGPGFGRGELHRAFEAGYRGAAARLGRPGRRTQSSSEARAGVEREAGWKGEAPDMGRGLGLTVARGHARAMGDDVTAKNGPAGGASVALLLGLH